MMKHQINSLSLLCLSALFCFSTLVGCSGGDASLAPVSGIVTLNGKALPGLRVTFYPEPAEGNANPGPFSTAVTDAEGKFSLVDRYGNPGAMVWRHKIEFEWDEMDEQGLSDAMEGDGDGKANKAEVAKAQAEMKKFTKIPKQYEGGGSAQFTVDVPSGGLESYALEMTSK
jgi:hypothetical protein